MLKTISYNHHVFVGDIGKSSKNYFSCGKRAALPNGVTSVMPGMSAPKAVPSHVKRQFPGGMPIAQIFGSGDDGGAIQYAVKGADNKIGFYVAPKDVIFSSSEFIVSSSSIVPRKLLNSLTRTIAKKSKKSTSPSISSS